jgi:hypothetical protein
MMRPTRRSLRRYLIAWILLLTTTAGSATAQSCAMTCLIFYGRFRVSNGEIFWYTSCTTTVAGGHTYIDCYYESGSYFY